MNLSTLLNLPAMMVAGEITLIGAGQHRPLRLALEMAEVAR
jgi:hypothetical protein